MGELRAVPPGPAWRGSQGGEEFVRATCCSSNASWSWVGAAAGGTGGWTAVTAVLARWPRDVFEYPP